MRGRRSRGRRRAPTRRRPGPPAAGIARARSRRASRRRRAASLARRARAAGATSCAARSASRGSVGRVLAFGEQPVEPAAVDEDLQPEQSAAGRPARCMVVDGGDVERGHGGDATSRAAPLSSWRPTELRRSRGYPRSCLQPRIGAGEYWHPDVHPSGWSSDGEPCDAEAMWCSGRGLWAFRDSWADGRTAGASLRAALLIAAATALAVPAYDTDAALYAYVLGRPLAPVYALLGAAPASCWSAPACWRGGAIPPAGSACC